MIPAHQTSEKKSDLPILIVDRVGVIGEALVNELKHESLIVFASGKRVEDENVIHVPYLKKIPTIPDNTYSHIFIIDEEALISTQFISPFIKKAQHDNSTLVLVIEKKLTDPEFVFKFISSYDKALIVVTGDIFSKDFIYDESSLINKFIVTAKEKRLINIPGDGTYLTSPIFFDDVILGILQAGFIEKGNNKIFFMYPQERFTLLSIAHMFQKKEPDIKIDFTSEKITPEKDLKIEGAFLTDNNYDLFSKIKKINLDVNKSISIERKITKENFKINPLITGIILTILIFFIIPFLSTIALALAGGLYLNNLKNDISSGNFTSAKNSANLSYNLFYFSEKSFALLQKEVSFIGMDQSLLFLSSKIEQGKEISFAAQNVIEGLNKIKSLANGNTKNSKADFQSSLDSLKTALVSYNREDDQGNIPQNIKDKIGNLINFSSSTIDLWPDILGFNGKKTYLILFQNNMELRPGGGFIGSYALATFDKGRLADFKIYDIYDADGQLKNHVEPPYPIRRYLPSINWYMRDSNWDVDFSKNAVSAAVFLNSEMHQQVDGVIGLDLEFVKNIIEQIGPIKVTDYNTIVTADNLYQVTESKAEDNFFPGSAQKKNFLKSLFNAINLKLSEKKDTSYFPLVQSFIKSIYEKHIIFAFNNLSLQTTFSVNGWGSTLFDKRRNDSNVVNDFTGINEANLGGNKVNFYITRSFSQSVNVGQNGQVSESLKINLKNNAPVSLGSKGIYKSYIRVVVPQGSKLSSIKINGVNQKIVDAITDPTVYEAKNFVPLAGLEVNKYDESGKTFFGFLTITNPEKLKEIIVNYVPPTKVNLLSPKVVYDNKFFKQSGVEDFPYSFSLSFPKDSKVIDKPSFIKFENGFLSFSKMVNSDFDFQINLALQ